VTEKQAEHPRQPQILSVLVSAVQPIIRFKHTREGRELFYRISTLLNLIPLFVQSHRKVDRATSTVDSDILAKARDYINHFYEFISGDTGADLDQLILMVNEQLLDETIYTIEQARHNHGLVVILLEGSPGAGKTTFALALLKKLNQKSVATALSDGLLFLESNPDLGNKNPLLSNELIASIREQGADPALAVGLASCLDKLSEGGVFILSHSLTPKMREIVLRFLHQKYPQIGVQAVSVEVTDPDYSDSCSRSLSRKLKTGKEVKLLNSILHMIIRPLTIALISEAEKDRLGAMGITVHSVTDKTLLDPSFDTDTRG
jgi:hypothetical protein